MNWLSIENLEAGRLAFLKFTEPAPQRWVGYVDDNGIAVWPEKIAGKRPAAWAELLINADAIREAEA